MLGLVGGMWAERGSRLRLTDQTPVLSPYNQPQGELSPIDMARATLVPAGHEAIGEGEEIGSRASAHDLQGRLSI